MLDSLHAISWSAFTLCLGLTLRMAVMEPLEEAGWVAPLFAPLPASAAELIVLGAATLVVFAAATFAGHAIHAARAIPPSARPLFVLPIGALSGAFVDRLVVHALSLIALASSPSEQTAARAAVAVALSYGAKRALDAAARHDARADGAASARGSFFHALGAALGYPCAHAWNALLAADVYARAPLRQPGAADVAIAERCLKVGVLFIFCVAIEAACRALVAEAAAAAGARARAPSHATQLRRMVLVYFVAFAADEPLDAWALHVRSGDRAVVDGRVSEYVFRAAVAAALFGAALLKAICQAPLSAAGGADAGDKRKGLSLRSNDEGGSWRFPVRRASPSPRAGRAAMHGAALARSAAVLASGALDALLGFALFEATVAPLRPAEEHPWRIAAFVIAMLVVCAINAARVKQRVNKELATAMGAERRIVSALHHGALGRALNDARDRVHHEGTPLVQSAAVQPVSAHATETSEA